MKRDRDIGRKAVLSDVKTAFTLTPALGRARTAAGSKFTQPDMRRRTLESSLCRPLLVEDVISSVLPSCRRREYFAFVYPRQMFQSTLFLVILIRMFLRFIFFVILVYNTTLRYENVNKNISRLFVCVSVTVQVAVTSVQAQNEIQTVCFENTST